MRALAGILVVAIVGALAGCGPACKLQAQRCSGGIAQLCGTDGQWRDVLDCSKMRNLKTCACESSKCTCRRAP